MGMMERFGRIADTYISERDKLLEADKERRRTFTGHPFWPTEVLRDTIIFASIVMTIAFYSWLIPPPLHSAAGSIRPSWIRVPRLVCSFLIWISQMGGVSPSVRHSCRPYW